MKIAIIGTIAESILGFRADLIVKLVSQGHEVFAFALDYNPSTSERVKKLGAVPVEYRFNRGGMNPLADAYNTVALSLLLRKTSPDLVFCYFSKPVIFGTLAAVLAGVKRRIGMLEGLGYIFTDQPTGISTKSKMLKLIQVFLYRISFPFLERIIFLNPDDPVDLVEKYNLRVGAVSVLGAIGLNLDSYPYLAARHPKTSFIFVGRLLAEKGINDSVAAAKLVKINYPDVEFVVLGGLDEKMPGGLSAKDLKKLIDDDVIIYPGHVTNVVEWITNSSVFVLPSYYREGIPRSTQEAMAVGRPVITTDVPGCRETVIDGVNGFLIPPWSPEVLAEKMIYFIENVSAIELMGMESNKIAREKFDCNIANNKLISYFQAQKTYK